jgi:Fungal specific transcription factor domain
MVPCSCSIVARNIAPLHYPPGLAPKYKHTNTATRVTAAMTDAALLHGILGATNGHLLFYAKMRTVSLSDILYHKTEAIHIVNQRMALASSKVMSDETLAAVAILITCQTRQGDYDEMKIHLRGLLELVGLRGGLQTLGMRGLLAGEIRWCDNVTALSSSAKPLLSSSEISKSHYKTFKSKKFLEFFETGARNESSPLWNPALRTILSDPLISALRELYHMTSLLNTSPQFSEHDMLVYDYKRATIQHEIANIDIPPTIASSFHITESCRLAAAIYSILAMYSFRPPLKLYGDLAKRLKDALMITEGGDAGGWGIWQDLLLWTLFVGGYAALAREERTWFAGRIGMLLREMEMVDLTEVGVVLEGMPVHRLLRVPFEVLWCEAVVCVSSDDQGGIDS